MSTTILNSEKKEFEEYLNREDRDNVFKGTIEGFKTLQRTFEWQDISDALDGMLISLQFRILNEQDIDEIRRMQGQASMLAFLQDLPKEIMDELETLAVELKEQETERDENE